MAAGLLLFFLLFGEYAISDRLLLCLFLLAVSIGKWSAASERFTYAKIFYQVFTAVDCDRITSRLIYYKIFCTMLFSIDVHRNSSIKLTKLLVRCLNASSLKSVLCHVQMTCVNTVCDILKAHPQSLHADWMIVKNVSNQCGANSMTAASWQTQPFESCISRKSYGG